MTTVKTVPDGASSMTSGVVESSRCIHTTTATVFVVGDTKFLAVNNVKQKNVRAARPAKVGRLVLRILD